MPKLVIAGFAIWVYTRDERGHQPHVHVFGNRGELVVALCPVTVLRKRNIRTNEAGAALRIVAEHRDELLALWSRYNG